MKRRFSNSLFVGVLIIIALLINPKELYDRIQAEKESEIISGLLTEGIGNTKYEIKNIKYVGGNEFFVETENGNLLIKNKREGSSSSYEIYVYEVSIQKFPGY